ncbi:hypothetical protein [uncultured Megasphaera sp.]|uniref:hypothetical protein n=1 Tax=uncultured Megasphaera sp. TaxID=165188 RepID=UPI00260A1662|nr:hypothetical protein [uncultured Megasphaera sp.]
MMHLVQQMPLLLVLIQQYKKAILLLAMGQLPEEMKIQAALELTMEQEMQLP